MSYSSVPVGITNLDHASTNARDFQSRLCRTGTNAFFLSHGADQPFSSSVTTRNSFIHDEFFVMNSENVINGASSVMISIFLSWICTIGYQAHNLVMFYQIRHGPAHYIVTFNKIRHGSRIVW